MVFLPLLDSLAHSAAPKPIPEGRRFICIRQSKAQPLELGFLFAFVCFLLHKPPPRHKPETEQPRPNKSERTRLGHYRHPAGIGYRNRSGAVRFEKHQVVVGLAAGSPLKFASAVAVKSIVVPSIMLAVDTGSVQTFLVHLPETEPNTMLSSPS
jgi:hypothetical protein